MELERIAIRAETEKDYLKISEITTLVFGQNNESFLINKLRENSRFIPGLSLVAEFNNEIIGYILFYPITINDGDHKHDSLALAPMSVHPEYQKMGVGGKLVKEGLSCARKMGFASVVVLGHPEYYPRFGFKIASTFGIKSPFEVPDNAFMVLELMDGTLTGVKGVVEYPKPFTEV